MLTVLLEPAFALLNVPENVPVTSSPSTKPEYETLEAVSYTHLTLPTILRV